MSGFLRESGKRHRLIIPSVDEKGISHSPVFGISSLGGKAIKEWIRQLYQMVIEYSETIPNPNTDKNFGRDIREHPISILKLRFAKGEISKLEYEERKITMDML
jgi:hypothetical protein